LELRKVSLNRRSLPLYNSHGVDVWIMAWLLKTATSPFSHLIETVFCGVFTYVWNTYAINSQDSSILHPSNRLNLRGVKNILLRPVV
jgi:hypothetical protein